MSGWDGWLEDEAPTTAPCSTCGAEGIPAITMRGRTFATCDECSARLREEQREEEERERGERRQAEANRRLELSGLPRARCELRLDQLDPNGREDALDAARRWATGDLQALLLMGSVGAGKTTLAGAAARNRCLRDDVRWTSAHGFVASLTAPFDSDQRRRAERLLCLDGRPSRNLAALAIDDIDKLRASEFAAESMFNLIDACESHRRPLIVTTNLDLAGLAKKWPQPYGEAIASRLAGYCEVYRLTGRDRRLDPQGASKRPGPAGGQVTPQPAARAGSAEGRS